MLEKIKFGQRTSSTAKCEDAPNASFLIYSVGQALPDVDLQKDGRIFFENPPIFDIVIIFF
jgi:hypothetical protein